MSLNIVGIYLQRSTSDIGLCQFGESMQEVDDLKGCCQSEDLEVIGVGESA